MVLSHACRGETGVGGGLKDRRNSYRGGSERYVAWQVRNTQWSLSEHTANTQQRLLLARLSCVRVSFFDCFTFTKVFFLSVLQLKCRLISLKKKEKKNMQSVFQGKKALLARLKDSLNPHPRCCVHALMAACTRKKKRRKKKAFPRLCAPRWAAI